MFTYLMLYHCIQLQLVPTVVYFLVGYAARIEFLLCVMVKPEENVEDVDKDMFIGNIIYYRSDVCRDRNLRKTRVKYNM